MKKILIITISLILSFSLASCAAFEVLEFLHDGVTYYYEYSDGTKTVTNYHPYKFWKLPNYQEMVQYGDDAGLENDGIVYFVYIVDTSIDSNDAKAYYSAEFDGVTKKLLCEDGEYFSSEIEKNAVVNRLINIIDKAYFK